MRDFGTGAIKITPAHDLNDFECGKRNYLSFLTIFTDEGDVSPGCGKFSGMKRFEARKAVLAALTEAGLYIVFRVSEFTSVNRFKLLYFS